MTSTAVAAPATIRLQGGIDLHYLDQGPATGEVLLMLHGWSDSSFSFSPVLPLLSPHVRAIVPDQRGHGDSSKPLDGYRMSDLAADALELLDGLGIRKATVIGHSMGGFVALNLAAIAPDRVREAVLVGSALDPRVDSIDSMREPVEALADPVDPLFIRDFQAGTIHKDVPEPFFERVCAESQKLPARVWKALYRGFMDYQPPDGARITSRVRLIWGDQDQIFSRADQERNLMALRGSTLTVLPGIGHAVHWEAPETFVGLLV